MLNGPLTDTLLEATCSKLETNRVPISVAKKAYQAYIDKDRALIESLIADNLHFTSPLDNRIDRATYFARCGPIVKT